MTTQAMIEWFFAIWTLTGVLVSLWNVGVVVRTRMVMHRHARDAATQFLLLDDIRREALLLVAQLGLCAPALLALLTPDRTGPLPTRSAVQLAALAGLLLAPAALAINSALDATARATVRDLARRAPAHKDGIA